MQCKRILTVISAKAGIQRNEDAQVSLSGQLHQPGFPGPVGGTSRGRVFEGLAQEQVGALGSFYYAFRGADLYLTFGLPDVATAASISMSIRAGWAMCISTVQLITPKEIDGACGRTVTYRPPGAE